MSGPGTETLGKFSSITSGSSVRACTPRRTPASSIRTNSAKTRASLNAPRATSDSSTSHCGNGYGHDRTEYSSTCTSYVESSGAESGSHGKERWRCGAIPATRETEFGGTRFKGVCAPGGGGVSGAEDGGGSGGGASGVSCTSCAWLASSCEGKGEGGIDASPGDDSSSDGIGESASVADITDCLDFIGEVSQALRRISREQAPWVVSRPTLCTLFRLYVCPGWIAP